MWKILEYGQARSKKTWRPRYPCEWQVVCHRAVSEVFVKDNKLSAFYGKQPSNDRELEESDMFIIIMAELDGKEHYFYLYIGRILMSVREIVTVMFTTEE